MDELEEIQAGQRKGFEAMHTSHWQFYFVLFCLLDFVCLFLFCLFFTFSDFFFLSSFVLCQEAYLSFLAYLSCIWI